MEFLIVDNDQTSRDVIGMLLEEEGHAAEGVAWTEQIWNRLAEKPLDALLIDLDSTPAGFDTLREIQRTRPGLPLVLLVVEIRLNLIVDATRLGILENLEKPFRREHLLLVIARLRRHMEMSRRIERLESKPAAQRIVIAIGPDQKGIAEPYRGKQPGPVQAR